MLILYLQTSVCLESCHSLHPPSPHSQDLHGLVRLFFGADGRGQLSLAAFRAFVSDLRLELLRLEFEHYDWQSVVGDAVLCRAVSCCASGVCAL